MERERAGGGGREVEGRREGEGELRRKERNGEGREGRLVEDRNKYRTGRYRFGEGGGGGGGGGDEQGRTVDFRKPVMLGLLIIIMLIHS